MSTWRTLRLHPVKPSLLAAISGSLLLIATGCDPAKDVQGVNTASSCILAGSLAQAPQALVGEADMASGLVGGGKTDISCSVLLAVAKVETDWGQTQTADCPAMDAKVPTSIKQEVDTSKLKPGGQTAHDLNLAGGRRICDWVSSAGAVGLMQFEPGTWDSEARAAAAAMPGLFGSSQYDPYDPTAAMIVAASYLGRLENGGIDGTHRSLHDALAAYNAGPANQSAGNGYADQVLSLANSSASSSTGASGSYANPLRSVQGLVPERIDQGVDYAQPGGSAPIYALGDGTVTNVTSSGWPNGVFIVYRLTDGPARGLYAYLSEDTTINVSVGEHVTSNTVLGHFEAGADGGYDIEAGWADPCSCQAIARKYSQYPSDGDATAFGRAFNQLMTALGAPSGRIEGPLTGTLPPGWPTSP